MYICMHACMYVCMYAHNYIHLCTYVHVLHISYIHRCYTYRYNKAIIIDHSALLKYMYIYRIQKGFSNMTEPIP